MRRHYGLPLAGFALVIGTLFLAGGLWELWGTHMERSPVPVALVPVLSVLAGAMLVVFALRRPRTTRERAAHCGIAQSPRTRNEDRART